VATALTGMIPLPAEPGGGPMAGEADEPGGSFRFRLFTGSGPWREGSRGLEEGD
jgi:hypothetical protein